MSLKPLCRFLASKRAFFTLIGLTLILSAGVTKGAGTLLKFESAPLDVILYVLAFIGFISYGLGISGLRYWIHHIRGKGDQSDPLW